jgi:hypothetical protein
METAMHYYGYDWSLVRCYVQSLYNYSDPQYKKQKYHTYS